MADTRIFLTTTGAGSWTVPADWNSADNSIEVLGGGGGGYQNETSAHYGPGGGGYSKITNLSLTPGNSVSYSVGVGGVAGQPPSSGGDTWFGNSVYSSSNVAAKGGPAQSSVGGQASAGIGTIKYSGGGAEEYFYAGGGGAAGPNGAGNNSAGHSGGVGPGGSGDAGFGGAGTGAAGTEWDSTHGSGGGGRGYSGSSGENGGRYGAGGGNSGTPTGGNGYQGIIVITYTALATGSSKFFQLFN